MNNTGLILSLAFSDYNKQSIFLGLTDLSCTPSGFFQIHPVIYEIFLIPQIQNIIFYSQYKHFIKTRGLSACDNAAMLWIQNRSWLDYYEILINEPFRNNNSYFLRFYTKFSCQDGFFSQNDWHTDRISWESLHSKWKSLWRRFLKPQ